jgi:uncharacterized protein YggU (UPF0235/DUF167 family)
VQPKPFELLPDGVRFRVRLTPRGGCDAIEGFETLADGRAILKARVRAAPAKGEANAALIALVARALGVPKSSVTIVAGATGRLKTLTLTGSRADLAKALDLLGAKLVP